MAEKGENKILVIIMISIILFSISFTGCIETSNEIYNKMDWHPSNPDIVVNDNGIINIVWESGMNPRKIKYVTLNENGDIENINLIGDGGFPKIVRDSNDYAHIIFLRHKSLVGEFIDNYGLFYTTIDNYGNIFNNNKEINKSLELIWETINQNIFDIVIDSENKIHILYSSMEGVAHLIIDDKGNTINESNLTKYMVGGCTDNCNIRKWISTNKIDNKVNFYILWDNRRNKFDYHLQYSKLFYLHQNNNNSIILNSTFMTLEKTYIRGNGIIFDSKSNGYIFWSEYKEIPGLYDPTYTNFSKIYPNGSINNIKQIKNLQITDVDIDLKDNIHIIGTTGAHGEFPDNDNGEYLKIDTKGNIIIEPIKFSNKVDHPLAKLAIDNDCNAHIVWKGEKEIWRTLPFSTQTESDSYYTIYYSKIDNNGTIAIKEKSLVADKEKEDQSVYSSICIIGIPCGLLIFIIILFIIINKLDKKLKKNKNNNNILKTKKKD